MIYRCKLYKKLGFNKPTAFEFVVVTHGKQMRVCAPSADDEVGWRRALIENERAHIALKQLIEEYEKSADK